MSMSGMILENINLVEGWPAVDLQTGANTGDWVSLAHYERCVVLFISGLGTAGDDPTLTLQQATDNAGTGVADLDFTTIYTKQAATSLASTANWTEVTQAAANTYTNATSAEQSAMWAVEFQADQLDVDGGYDHLRATVADVGANAQPGYLLYLLGNPRTARAVDSLISAL